MAILDRWLFISSPAEHINQYATLYQPQATFHIAYVGSHFMLEKPELQT